LKITIPYDKIQKTWTYYDHGPKKVKTPLICIPSVSGSTECYYKILYSLSAQGYRVIAVTFLFY